MVVRDKLIIFYAGLRKNGVKKIPIPQLKKLLATFFGVKESTAETYLKDLIILKMFKESDTPNTYELNYNYKYYETWVRNKKVELGDSFYD